ncbi:hypothetical protein SISNIDRAFT_250638 [Sistotremastrum niveocremeum HHB9708]|uniref:Uncharacterized protein n=1 Tax=Sistotremastrum niveocremeum HHB9708 TaxID=1314777 RepID=A0A164YY27_9AGAM|nr:hypothetical protein SISNIDRAFT_250638 [Sistotremastrum niveocremeum HHB9708]
MPHDSAQIRGSRRLPTSSLLTTFHNQPNANASTFRLGFVYWCFLSDTLFHPEISCAHLVAISALDLFFIDLRLVLFTLGSSTSSDQGMRVWHVKYVKSQLMHCLKGSKTLPASILSVLLNSDVASDASFHAKDRRVSRHIKMKWALAIFQNNKNKGVSLYERPLVGGRT